MTISRAGPRAESFRGLLFMLPGILLVPVMDALAKVGASRLALPVGEITLARFAVQTLLVAPLLWMVEGRGGFAVGRPLLNLVRGAIIGVASLFFFLAVKAMPLADAIAIFFVEPLILTILSALVLKERVSPRRWLAVAVGFLGALVVIRPNVSALGAVALLPLATATLFAVYLLLNRSLARTGSALALQFYAGCGGLAAIGAGVLAGTAFGVAEAGFSASLDLAQASLLIAVGAVAFAGHLLITRAFQLAPASLLAPFQYLEILSATLLGLVLFDDFPDGPTIVGIAIIVASGLSIVLDESRAGSAVPDEADP